MNVLLLAAGLGTRLSQYTNTTPKCLLPVKQTPILSHWMEKLLPIKKIKNIFINTHHHQEKVVNYLNIVYPQAQILIEPILLGTAGTLISNLNLFKDDDLLVIHADLYSSIDISDFLRVGNSVPCTDCLLGVFKPDTLTGCGILEINEGKIISFCEKPSVIPQISSNLYANGAVYLFKKKMLDFIKLKFTADTSDIAADILPKIIDSVVPYYIHKYHIDIGTINGYEKAQNI